MYSRMFACLCACVVCASDSGDEGEVALDLNTDIDDLRASKQGGLACHFQP